MRQIAVIVLTALCSSGLCSFPALAAPVAPTSARADSLKKALESGDEARALGALNEIEAAKSAAGAPLVDALLVRGANSTLVLRALAVEGALQREHSSAAIAPYVRHRSAEVRLAAARSLIQTKGPAAVGALRDALHASDAAVRGVAATGLGALHATEAVPDLFVVLPKDTPEAAFAIGSLCSGDDCQRFTRLIGKLPFETMASGLLPMLSRPAGDVPDSLKLQLIGKLQRMATPKATAVLATALAAYPTDGNPKVRAALDAAAHGRVPKDSAP